MLIKRFVLSGFICTIFSLGTLIAQPQLNRVSITERSDGNGYVIRYHLTEMVESYDLTQPETNRIQMQLFSPSFSTEAVVMPEISTEFTDIELIEIDEGIGVDIRTGKGVFFTAEAYPDQNQRDLLLNLEYTTQAEAEELASDSELYDWSIQEPEAEPEFKPEPEINDEPETAPRVQGRPLDIHFGFAGGLGIANKIGGGYTSDSRQEMTMGLTVEIGLPFTLPYSLKPAVESGLFYTQKGLKNPSGGDIEAQTIVLDYIEVPVMGKLIYELNQRIEPYAVGGFYTAFRTAAETVQKDGDRDDLGDVTRNIDVGLVAGIGSDFVFEKATISVQVRGGVGIPPMFKEDYSGAERPVYLSLLLGFQF